jgi:hypothetical protein
MKQSLIILLISVYAANAQMWTNVETGAVAPQPSRRPADAVNVSEEWYAAEGWQPFNLAQQADWDAARAAAQEQAEAEAAAIAAHAAKKAAAKTAKGKGKGLPALAERVAALEALNGIE